MDWLPSLDQFELFGHHARQGLVQSGMLQYFHFTLVLFRMSGLMMVAPGYANSYVPAQVRILLIISVSLLVTPSLPALTQSGFERLDSNGDNLLQPIEIPEQIEARIAAIKRIQGLSYDSNSTVSPDEYGIAAQFPPSVLDYLWIVIGELGLGLLLGLGVMAILSSLQMAGQMIDQQAGTSLGELFNPELNSSVSVTGEMLYLVGTIIFLSLGGHRLLLESVIDSFRTFPVGQSFISEDAVVLLSNLVHQSLLLALQVSAPIMAIMSVISLAMGFLGHTVPQINVLTFGFPVKVLAGFFVVSMSLAGMGELIADSVPEAVATLRKTLSGYEPPLDSSSETEPFRPSVSLEVSR